MVFCFFDELDHLEEFFQINEFLCTNLEGSDFQSAELIKRSRKIFSETLYLNLYKNHLSYIFDFAKYSHSYACSKCGKLWPRKYKLKRHQKSCDENVKRKYPGKAFHCFQTVFEDLDDLGITTPNDLRFYLYHATYDYECLFSKTDFPPPTDKMSFSAVYVFCSVSACSNLEGFETPVCFVREGNALKMTVKKVGYLESIARVTYGNLRPKSQFLFDQLGQIQGKWAKK